MTGPAHSVETSYEPHRNLITGVVNRSRVAAEVGGRKSGKRGRGTNIQFHAGQLAGVKSLAGEFSNGYDESNPALLTKMTGPAHEVETSYEPHRNLITGVVNRSRLAAEVGSRTSGVGGDEGAPGAVAGLPAQDADGTVARSATGGAIVSSYVYANDLLGRRETISQGGEAFGMLALGENRVEVAYNDRSEVVGSVTRRGDIPVARHTYAYDAIGNLQRSASEVGDRKSEVSYEANALNQYVEVKTLSVDSVNSVGRPVHDPGKGSEKGEKEKGSGNQYPISGRTRPANVESLAGEFAYGDVGSHPALLTKMTGPAHEVETSYEAHRNLITGVVNKGKHRGRPGEAEPLKSKRPDAGHISDPIQDSEKGSGNQYPIS